jgi:hypothetical protein
MTSEDLGSLGARAPSCGSPEDCQVDAVQVNAADFNGFTFDSFPFSAKPAWLTEALRQPYPALAISPETARGGFDYAVWSVKWFDYRKEGDVKYLAWPGDWVVRGPDGQLSVCPDALFTHGLPRAVSAPEGVATTPDDTREARRERSERGRPNPKTSEPPQKDNGQ